MYILEQCPTNQLINFQHKIGLNEIEQIDMVHLWILYNFQFIDTEYNGNSVWLGTLTGPAPARSRAAGMEPGCAGRGGGRSINKFTGGSKLDLFCNKIKTVE